MRVDRFVPGLQLEGNEGLHVVVQVLIISKVVQVSARGYVVLFSVHMSLANPKS